MIHNLLKIMRMWHADSYWVVMLKLPLKRKRIVRHQNFGFNILAVIITKIKLVIAGTMALELLKIVAIV